MLSEKILQLLNEQIGHEYYSSNFYLAMSSWCGFKGLRGSCSFLSHHAGEEMEHMRKLFGYVGDTGAQAIVPQVQKPPESYDSIRDVFSKTLEHEIFITRKINELVGACMLEKDYSTFSFLQWYVAEQHEEEKLFRSILDLIEIIGTDGRGLFLLDKEIGKLARAKGGEVAAPKS
jgi:ferritin